MKIKNKLMDNKTALILFVVMVVGIGYWYTNQPKTNTPVAPETNQVTPSENVIPAIFNCDKGITINAEFDNNQPAKVKLAISDGRTLELPQAMSASGARYANADETIVFWNKGNTAFMEENGTTTITGCLTK